MNRLLALAVVAVAAGCGGGQGFFVRADAICGRAAEEVAELPRPPTPADLTTLFERREAIGRRELAALRALDPPDGTHVAFAGLVAAIEQELAEVENLRVAALSSDLQMVQGAMHRSAGASLRAQKAARELGLETCA